MAAHQIMHEGADAAIGGGVESITMMHRSATAIPNPWVKEHKPGIYMVMGDTAEVVAKRYKISRQAQDEYSLLSASSARRARSRKASSTKSWRRCRSTRGILDKKTGEVVGKEEHYVDEGRVQSARHDARRPARARSRTSTRTAARAR